MAQLYEIRLKGHLDPCWWEWLGDFAIVHQDNGETLLTGSLADQAALHGLLKRLQDFGIVLISINPVGEAYTTDD